MKKIFLLSFVLLASFGLSGCGYNDFTAKQQNVRKSWADIETQLQRRADFKKRLSRTSNRRCGRICRRSGRVVTAHRVRIAD